MLKKIWKFIIKILILIVLAFSILLGNLFFQGYQKYEEAISLKPIDIAVSEIMNKEDFVPNESISSDFLNALVSIEDHRFYERKGIDYYSIGRALFFNAVTGSLQQGGSTITQQLAKNIYFSHAKSLTRKVAEIFLVKDLEAKYTKAEIITLYANIIYYGDGYNGISKASNGYFKKNPLDLSLYEASLLAGLPQSPTKLQLSNGYEEANKRQKAVLESMVKNGYISQEEYEATMKLQP